ncbi:MAG TPA: ribosomal protein S18-alanine N-acetyltransferase [Nitrospirota bacterium]|nr:ribosomal protein S18-alanine N-acetyltransferase [Nitrospirota bacterium]
MGETNGITIEPMQKNDLEQVMAIEQASFTMPWSRNLFLSELRSRTVATLLVALAQGTPGREVVGYIVYWLVADEMHILNLATSPAYRRKRIAKRLVLTAIKTAFDSGARLSFLEVRASNVEAQKLYADIGFISSYTREEYYDQPVEDAVVMKLERKTMEEITLDYTV